MAAKFPPAPARPAWTVTSQSVVFSAPPIIDVVRQEVVTDSGAVVPDFYKIVLRPFALCVPVTRDGGVVTLWQYKHGAGRYSLNFPGGHQDPGEAALAACQRELLEETGMVANRYAHLGEFVDNGNQQGCTGNFYLALDCEVQQTPDSGDLETMDQIEMAPDDVDAALRQGWIPVVHHAAAWSLARLHGW